MAVNFENGMEMALPLEGGGGGGGAVDSVFGRTGDVVATAGDYAVADITGLTAALAAKAAGAASSTDNAVARFDSTTGKIIQNSGVIIDDSNNVTGIGTLASGTQTVTGNIVVSGTVDGRDVSTDGTKLDGIGAGASAIGAGSAVDNTLPRFDGTGGKQLQTSGVVVDDSNNVSGVVGLTMTGNITLSTGGATVDGVDLTALNTTVGTNTTNISSNTSAIALKADLSQAINTQSGTTYTIQASDNGKLIRFTNAAAVAVTVPDTIVPSAGTCFLCNLSQETAAGQITVAGSGTMAGNVVHPGLTLKSRTQNSEITLRIFSATSARLAGDLASV